MAAKREVRMSHLLSIPKLSLLTVALLAGLTLGTVLTHTLRESAPHAYGAGGPPPPSLIGGGMTVTTPQVVAFQGYLRNPATGNAIAPGNYQLTFSLYTKASGGTPLWTEIHTVSLNRGVFQVFLGASSPLPPSLLNTPQLWLGVKVGAGNELSPRLRLGSVFYARSTETANNSARASLTPKRIAANRWYALNSLGGPKAGLNNMTAITSIVFNGTKPLISTQDLLYSPRNNEYLDLSWTGGCSGLASDGRGRADQSGFTDMWCARPKEIRSYFYGGNWDDNVPYPCSDCRRLAFDGRNLWATKYDTNQLLKLDILDQQHPSLIADFAVPANPTGLAFDGENIWVVSSGANTLVKIRPSDGTTLLAVPTGAAPTDIQFDGDSVWLINTGANTVSKYRALDGALLGTFPVGNSPQGITFDGGMVWVLNVVDRTVTQLRATDGEHLATFPVAIDGVQVKAVSAMAYDGEGVWIGVQEATGGQKWVVVRY